MVMGSLVSPIVTNRYMEYLEQEALASVLVVCKPKYWMRHVDDTLEIIKKGMEKMLT